MKFKFLFVLIIIGLLAGCGMGSKLEEEKTADQPAPTAPALPDQRPQTDADKKVEVIEVPKVPLTIAKSYDIVELRLKDEARAKFGIKPKKIIVDRSKDSFYSAYLEFPSGAYPKLYIHKLEHWTKEYALNRIADTLNKDGKITAYQSDDNLDGRATTNQKGTVYGTFERPQYVVYLNEAGEWHAKFLSVRVSVLKEKAEDDEIPSLANGLFSDILSAKDVQAALAQEIQTGDVSEIKPEDITYIRTNISISTTK